MFSCLLVALLGGCLALAGCGGSSATHAASNAQLLATNPYLDPGASGGVRLAPNFTLTDERGHRISLSSYRGKVVLLAFNDAECTTICPLTTTAMLDAKRMLGSAGRDVQLLGIDANPDARKIHDVLSYTELHGLLGQWHFLTGSLKQLKAVWKAYKILVEIQRGLIDHTPALYVIDPQGRIRDLFLTTQSYAAVPQLGQLIADEASRLIPGHPAVDSHLSYATVKGIGPNRRATAPLVGGGSTQLGPGHGDRLLVFFDSWDREVLNLRRDLDELNGYAAAAKGGALPQLTAVDEASVEPSAAALPKLLAGLRRPLAYPVALDRSGRIADGYEVQDQPWFVLVSGTGKFLWYEDASTVGWPTVATLEGDVKAATAKLPASISTSAAAAEQGLAGSPAPLAALHAQAGQLLAKGLLARIHALRGYPVVVNIWASWCVPCQQEFGLLARASELYGKRIAFLGADYNDPNAADARAFLRSHPVSYPSYTLAPGAIDSLLPGGIEGTPTTFFIGPAGGLRHVHTGAYDSLGTLEQDIQTYALSG